ncbi:TWiK family of potassium channels protein 7 like protein [Argiope bruennichi]|uniref:TWiK family of potassium channels protein 7 like protein n=1 Tax=Argiope bruennichi TaxID=94029 RepID=A0A8T0FKD1_ARGBR|nr:TWiK family of potassium channels protein 7 like protein [Argiope bruennichi]
MADLIDKVDDLVRSDRRVTLRILAVKVDVRVRTVWTIVHDSCVIERATQLSCYEELCRPLSSVADYECECWRTDPALAAGGGVPTAISTPPCVLEMTLDTTLKKNKKKQKQSKKSKISSSTPGRCRRCCGRFTAFLFSHVGLCALVIGYSIMGAFAFRALEAPYEEQKASQVGHLRQETVRRLWEITDKLNVLYKDNWTELVEAEVRRFQKELIVAVKEGYDGKEGSIQQWSFSGAFLYSLTVITTIVQLKHFSEVLFCMVSHEQGELILIDGIPNAR